MSDTKAAPRAQPLSYRQRELLKKAADDWRNLPPGVGCTNATLEALERRGIVETRIDQEQRRSWHGGWQFRKTPTDKGAQP